MPNINTILIVMVSLTAFAVLMQVISIVVMAIIAAKAVKEAKVYAEEFRTVATPVLEHSKDLLHLTKDLIERLEPRLEAAATDLADIAHTAKEESRKIGACTDEIAERIRRQAERVDGMATNALNGVDRMGRRVGEAVDMPIRRLSGMLAAARAIIETLRGPAPAQHRARPDASAETESGQFV